MAGGTDNNCRGHRQQSTKTVDDNKGKDKDNNDDNEHNEHKDGNDKDDKHDNKVEKYNKQDHDKHNNDDHDDNDHNDNDNNNNNNNDNNNGDDGDNKDNNNGDDDGHKDSDSGSGWRQRLRWQQHGRSYNCRGHANNCPGYWHRWTCLSHHLGGLWVLVVMVVCGVVHAGCVCAARTCCSVRNHSILGITRKLVTRQAKLLHLIEADL